MDKLNFQVRFPLELLALMVLGLALAFTVLSPLEQVQAAPARETRPAWQVPTDAGEALNTPDQFAWEMFVALNWPADLEHKTADPALAFGTPEVPVTWQTWKLQEETYRHDGVDPGPWDAKAGFVKGALDEAVCFPLQQHILQDSSVIPCEPNLSLAFQEVRLNRATYDFIRAHELYNVEGLLKAFELGEPIKFVTDSIEIKAVWRPIAETDKTRYFWIDNVVTATVPVTSSTGITQTTVTTKTIWGLTGLHITSRVLPNWFWSTFEHVDNPYRLPRFDAHGNAVNEPWLIPSADAFACADPPYDCNRAPDTVSGVSLRGTVWENYRLRGAQTDFVDLYGNPTRVANSEIETGFQLGASCMTCHSLAVVGPAVPGGLRLGSINFLDPASLAPGPRSTANGGGGYLGAPEPGLFQVPGTPNKRFLQTDFVWSAVICANWKNPPRQDPLPGQSPPPKRGPVCGYPPGEAPGTK